MGMTRTKQRQLANYLTGESSPLLSISPSTSSAICDAENLRVQLFRGPWEHDTVDDLRSEQMHRSFDKGTYKIQSYRTLDTAGCTM